MIKFYFEVLVAVSQLSSLYSGFQKLAQCSAGYHGNRDHREGALLTTDFEGSLKDELIKIPTLIDGKISVQALDVPLSYLCPLLTCPDFVLSNEVSAHSSVSACRFFTNRTGTYINEQVLPGEFASFGFMKDRRIQACHQAIQQRGFKTLHTRQRMGIGKDKNYQTFLDEIKATLASLLFRSKSRKPKHPARLNGIIESLQAEPDVQNKILVAFAEGYRAKERSDEGKEGSVNKVFRFLLYGFAVYLAIQAFQVFSAVGGGPIRGFGMLRGDFQVNPEDVLISFSDVKGVDEAKQELKDIVEFLRDPDKFTALGAKLPKGCLLVGPPGIGKTLLARAVAGEAGVPFFQVSGSEFDEVFVGTGAKRIRQLFASAKLKAPCVIFIDEIDSVGAKRTSSQIHPYANQTINQLLSEMDGFEQNEGVIVLGATNRRDNLDQALLRPGRFDVEVRVLLPDLKGRNDILEYYVSKIKKDSDIDVDVLARGTTGFTGADLENLVNQAALKAAIDEADTVTMQHFDFARDKVLMGPAKKTKIQDEETNHNTAFHEAGHTLVAYFTKDAVPLYKVTILPRGLSLGHTSFICDKEVYGKSMLQLKAEIDVAMGGRAAEELIFGLEKVTTGGASDFQHATHIATAMVKRFGMSDKVGMRSFDDETIDNGLSVVKINDISPAIQEQVDLEIKRLLQESYERAKAILQLHSSEHRALAMALLDKETLDKDQIAAIIEKRPLPA